jgi:hypothetical protein
MISAAWTIQPSNKNRVIIFARCIGNVARVFLSSEMEENQDNNYPIILFSKFKKADILLNQLKNFIYANIKR